MNKTFQRIQSLIKNDTTPLVWLFAGNSITMGAGHTMGWRDYTQLFAERMRWELQRRRDHVINTAISGWRVGAILEDVEWSILRHRPSIVSINVGMNDCASDTGVSEEIFREQYLQLIDRARSEGDPPIMIHTPNRILPGDQRRAPRLEAFCDVIREIAVSAECLLIDHHAAWRQAEQAATIPHWLSDAIHPNEYGHRAMARTLFQALGIFDEVGRTCRLFIP